MTGQGCEKSGMRFYKKTSRTEHRTTVGTTLEGRQVTFVESQVNSDEEKMKMEDCDGNGGRSEREEIERASD